MENTEVGNGVGNTGVVSGVVTTVVGGNRVKHILVGNGSENSGVVNARRQIAAVRRAEHTVRVGGLITPYERLGGTGVGVGDEEGSETKSEQSSEDSDATNDDHIVEVEAEDEDEVEAEIID